MNAGNIPIPGHGYAALAVCRGAPKKVAVALCFTDLEFLQSFDALLQPI